MDPARLYVNVGFWSTVPLRPGRADGHLQPGIEDEVAELGGHKSLYSDAFYDEDDASPSSTAAPPTTW